MMPNTPVPLRMLALATGAGWGFSLGAGTSSDVPVFCGDLIRTLILRSDQAVDLLFQENPPVPLVMGWIAMLLAMMSPLLSQPTQDIWQRSLPRRRWRAIGLFLAGYATPWLAAGAVLPVVVLAITVFAGNDVSAFAVGLAICLIWQASPWRQRAMNRCHRRPRLGAFGMQADRDTLRYGLEHGTACTHACWAWMLLPLLLAGGWHMVIMGLVTLGIAYERTLPPRSPNWHLPFGDARDRLAAHLQHLRRMYRKMQQA